MDPKTYDFSLSKQDCFKIEISLDSERNILSLQGSVFLANEIPDVIVKYVDARKNHFFKPHKTFFSQVSDQEIVLVQEIPFLEPIAKLICPRKSKILRPVERAAIAARSISANSTPGGLGEENGLNSPQKDDFNGQMSFAIGSQENHLRKEIHDFRLLMKKAHFLLFEIALEDHVEKVKALFGIV